MLDRTIRLFTARFRHRQELRPTGYVPRRCALVLLAAFAAQIVWYAWLPHPQVRARELPPPPPADYLRFLGFGEPAVVSRVVSLWLQAFDNQPGISLSFASLDYERVTGWLAVSLRLDERTHYPLLAATHLYAEVPDRRKVRRMLAFIEAEYKKDPAYRWRWMAHAVLLAKHRLRDLPLALALARQLTEADLRHGIPGWARQMQIFVLEELGELDAARILVGAMLDSGEITSEQERQFLMRRLTIDSE